MKKSASQPISPRTLASLRGKKVMVTGACGTVGQQLVQQLLAHFEIAALTGLDNNESALMFLDERHSTRGNARFVLCDVRDLGALLRETRKVDILFHAAAYKHVYLCERSPIEAIQTNILGVQNVIQAAVENGIERSGICELRQSSQPDQRDGYVEADGGAPDHRGRASSRPGQRTFPIDPVWQRSGLARFCHSHF